MMSSVFNQKNRRALLLGLVFFFLTPFVFAPFVVANETSCSSDNDHLPQEILELEVLVAKLNQTSHSSELRLITDLRRQIDSKLEELGISIFRLYRRHRWTESSAIAVNACLISLRIEERFQNALPRIFLSESIKELRKSNSPRIHAFANAIEKGGTFFFKAFGYTESAPTDNKGGFHRGRHSLFLDFQKTPPDEWLLILIHEFSHRLDEHLNAGVRIYGDPTLNKSIDRILAQPIDTLLLEEDQNRLNLWLRAGLDRGLLAEWRSWIFTVFLYRDGLQDGLWPQIDWISEMLPKESVWTIRILMKKVFQYLNPRFTNPTEGDFSDPRIQNSLIQMRLQMEENAHNGEFPELGTGLQSILLAQ